MHSLPQPLLDSGSPSPQRLGPSAVLLVLRPRGGNHSTYFGGVCILQGGLVSSSSFGRAAEMYDDGSSSEIPRLVASSGEDGAESNPGWFNSLISLVLWHLWKHRNACVFVGMSPSVTRIILDISADMWCMVSAKGLSSLGLGRVSLGGE
jgi:hypothetical protein